MRKSFVGGGGFRRNFNHTFTIIIPSRYNSRATTGNWTINDAWGTGIKVTGDSFAIL